MQPNIEYLDRVQPFCAAVEGNKLGLKGIGWREAQAPS